MSFTNTNIKLINDVIDKGNLNEWNMYSIGNCDTRDLYYINNPNSNYIYCISAMMKSDVMVNEMKSKLPNFIIDDVTMSLYIYNYYYYY